MRRFIVFGPPSRAISWIAEIRVEIIEDVGKRSTLPFKKISPFFTLHSTPNFLVQCVFVFVVILVIDISCRTASRISTRGKEIAMSYLEFSSHLEKASAAMFNFPALISREYQISLACWSLCCCSYVVMCCSHKYLWLKWSVRTRKCLPQI